MKKHLLFFLTRIIIPGLIALLILSACFLLVNRNKKGDKEKRKNNDLMMNIINRPSPLLSVYPAS
jgi:hypothetical protein